MERIRAIDTHFPAESPAMTTMRRLMLALLVIFMLGTTADLMLLDHHEGPGQLVPLVLLALGLVVAAWSLGGRPGAILTMRIIMVLFVGAGFLGMALHYLGTREFQHEMDPSLAGWPLFVKIITAKAPPALAPASMIQMGLLGLLYTYRHPAVHRHL